jgi:hypothetical protein
MLTMQQIIDYGKPQLLAAWKKINPSGGELASRKNPTLYWQHVLILRHIEYRYEP